MGGNERQQNKLIQSAFKEITWPFIPTEILNVVYVLKDSKIKSFLQEDWKVGAQNQSQSSCEAPHGHLLSHFISAPAAPVSKGKPSLIPQSSRAARPGWIRAQLPLHPPLREHSQPQTALHKPESANPWRSLVFWFCLGETRASRGTDTIPQSVVQASGRGMPKACCRSLKGVCQRSGLFWLDCTSWWMLLQLPGCGLHLQCFQWSKQNQDFKPHSWWTELFQESFWFQD